MSAYSTLKMRLRRHPWQIAIVSCTASLLACGRCLATERFSSALANNGRGLRSSPVLFEIGFLSGRETRFRFQFKNKHDAVTFASNFQGEMLDNDVDVAAA